MHKCYVSHATVIAGAFDFIYADNKFLKKSKSDDNGILMLNQSISTKKIKIVLQN